MTGRRTRSDEEPIDLDELFAALGHPVRRRILRSLVEEPSREVEELATAWLDAERSRAEVQLRHVHLPHLGEKGIIGWDRETGRITRERNFESVAWFLGAADDCPEEPLDD